MIDSAKLRKTVGVGPDDVEKQHLLVQEDQQPSPASTTIATTATPATTETSSTMSGRSLFFFLILIGQSVGTQTFFKLSQKGGAYDYNTMSAMAVVEGIKFSISFGQLMLEQRGNLTNCKGVFKNVERRVYFAYVFLAVSYAVYNQLIFYVMKLADPGTFALFKSLMPAAVGLMNFVSFGKTLTQTQVMCITITIFGIVPVATSTDSDSGKVAFMYGTQALIIMIFTVTFAAFNTVYNASVVKKESANYPMNVQNSILYAAGFSINLLSYIVSKRPGDKPFFYGYNNLNVIVLLFLNSTVGITISMVYKYGDAVLKTLSQPVVSSVLVFLSNILFDVPLDIVKLSGAGTVIVSTMVYLKLPPPAPSVAGESLPIFKRGGFKLRAAVFFLMGVGILLIMRLIMSTSAGEMGGEDEEAVGNFNATPQSPGN
eukprot:CAMPEP_0201675720 /NCGR_PEP_ID=MMETSP0494-20130426/40169_1 /ASSEMBLY_ACC=CAM_ASM_000839 /TAXON_ID=420259 /ORGANISM="Thalassiosira gravida, Strain GMp14c1" /LENGTH=428 /DNA_ID=CAMNT_0048158239 /DNA_START=107 /DNA_END=1393 /DNA_ORIENTATION=-